jgi:hypothetical protein
VFPFAGLIRDFSAPAKQVSVVVVLFEACVQCLASLVVFAFAQPRARDANGCWHREFFVFRLFGVEIACLGEVALQPTLPRFGERTFGLVLRLRDSGKKQNRKDGKKAAHEMTPKTERTPTR